MGQIQSHPPPYPSLKCSVILQLILMEIIDSHTHWGPSLTMGTEVTTEELLRQAEESGVDRIVIFPFPSTALADEGINERLLDETSRIKIH